MVGYSLFIILTFVALGSFYYFGRDISQFISKGFLFKTNLTENLPVSTVTDFVSFNKFKQGTKIFSEKVFIPEQTISFTEANTINKKVPLSPTTQVHIWLPSQEKKDHRDLLEISVTSKKQTIDFKTGFKFTDLTKQQYSFNINIKESIPSTEFAQKVKAYTFNSAASSGLTVNTNCSDADSNSVFNTPTSSTPRSPVSSNSW